MTRRTNAQIAEDEAKEQREADAMTVLAAAALMDAYGVPASANVLRVVGQSIWEGKRERISEGP